MLPLKTTPSDDQADQKSFIWDLQYPEIDTRSFVFDGESNLTRKNGGSDSRSMASFDRKLPVDIETSVDVLNIQFSGKESTNTQDEQQYTCNFRPGLNHEEIPSEALANGYNNDHQSTPTASIRVLFLNDLPSSAHVKHSPGFREPPAALGSDTAEYLIKELGVSPIFISAVTTDPWVIHSGNACFQRRNYQGRIQVDGFYRFSGGSSTRQLSSNVWFSHTLGNEGVSTYIIRGCPDRVKHSILCTAENPNNSPVKLLRPLAVDAFLAEGSVHEYGKEFLRLRARLVQFERENMKEGDVDAVDQNGMKRDWSADTNRTVKELHILSQHFHILKEDLTELIEGLGYLRLLHKTVTEHDISDQTSESTSPRNALALRFTSTAHSFDYLSSKVGTWKGWTQNYIERTSILINMLFNFSNQRDNQTNLRVADYTRKIAIATQRDSSSMIAMAAVTMFFLPGAFVSAIFSMVFFETKSDGNGPLSIQASPQVWMFFAIAVPLTIAVFALWYLLRSHIHLKNLKAFDGGEIDAKAVDGGFLDTFKPFTFPPRGAEIENARPSRPNVHSFTGSSVTNTDTLFATPRPPSPPKRYHYISRNLDIKSNGPTANNKLDAEVSEALDDTRMQSALRTTPLPLTPSTSTLLKPHHNDLPSTMDPRPSGHRRAGSSILSKFGVKSSRPTWAIAIPEDEETQELFPTPATPLELQPNPHRRNSSEISGLLYDNTRRDERVPIAPKRLKTPMSFVENSSGHGWSEYPSGWGPFGRGPQ
ncbi:hypothetical protein FA15DRAFT_724066 [Coprinopsis marcescibilis]|uniref:Cora-domain-containing protein n=1 Tax=Coprinopsis marcescibilis TaxID=230819 RepID=A0A5C3LG63_COPMA|nr:hypothetical protein FA15DRAFT_724066 [Coprinopsis marcescibilis]